MNQQILDRIFSLESGTAVDASPLTPNDEKTVQIVLEYLKTLPLNTPEFDNEKLIDKLLELNLEYEVERCLGNSLVQMRHINPFNVLCKTTDQNFWSIWLFFEESFSLTNAFDTSEIIKSLDIIYQNIKNDSYNSSVGTSISTYFIMNISQLEELFELFVKSPSESIAWILNCSASIIAEKDFSFFKQRFSLFLESDDPLIMYTGLSIIKNMPVLYSSEFGILIPHIIDIINRHINNSDYKNFVALSIAVIYKIACATNCLDKYDNLIINLIDSGSDTTKLYFGREVYNQISDEPQSFNRFSQKIINIICNSSIENNQELIEYIDWLILWEFEHSFESEAWSNMETFMKINKNIEISKSLNSVYSCIMKNFEKYLPFIYSAIYVTTEVGSLGLQLFNNIHSDFFDVYKINWMNGLVNNEISIITKKFALSCTNPPLLVFWSMYVLLQCDETVTNDFMQIYKELICDNYPYTCLKVIEEFNPSEYKPLLMLQEYCRNIIDEGDRISKQKDFMPSSSRMKIYNLAQKKQSRELMEESEKRSIFADLFHKTTMKYGNKYGLIIENNSDFQLSQSEYEHFEYSIELPRIFIANPMFYRYEVSRTFMREANI